MGQTPVLSEPGNRRKSPLWDFLRTALNAAEKGWLPDAVVRMGIRRLLRERLRQLHATSGPDTLVEFLKTRESEPIAVLTDRANEQHYELPAAFYQQVLGNNMKYSCCYWQPGENSLDNAERHALALTCGHADLADGQNILELGCGWGSLSLYMAEHYPQSRITAISNSHSQKRYIEKQIRQRGLKNLRIITADINGFEAEEIFDRVVSVEMFEHMRNHKQLLSKISRWLRPSGKLFVHIFCHRQWPYLFETEGEHNWMGRYFFSGGMMPSEQLLIYCSEDLKPVSQWRWNGSHYAKTCRSWLRRQDAAREEFRVLFQETYGERNADRWFQRWRMFFMACEELFAFRDGNEWFVSHYLFQASR